MDNPRLQPSPMGLTCGYRSAKNKIAAAHTPAPRTISARLFSVKSSVIQNAMSLKTGGYLEKGWNLVRMSPSVNWSRNRLSELQNNLHHTVMGKLCAHTAAMKLLSTYMGLILVQ